MRLRERQETDSEDPQDERNNRKKSDDSGQSAQTSLDDDDGEDQRSNREEEKEGNRDQKFDGTVETRLTDVPTEPHHCDDSTWEQREESQSGQVGTSARHDAAMMAED